jgi:hypothetical protein
MAEKGCEFCSTIEKGELNVHVVSGFCALDKSWGVLEMFFTYERSG